MGIFNRHRHLRAEILSEYLDGRLDQQHLGLVDRRLADCSDCREELATLQATVSTLRSLPDLPLPRSFTLPIAPSPGYAADLIRKPDPLLMRMPGWVYGGAASVASLVLALMLSAEAAGLASPQSLAAPSTSEETALAQAGAPVQSPVPSSDLADRAPAPADSQAAKPPQAALRAESAPAAGAAMETDDSALAAKILVDPAGPALEMPDQAQTPAALQQDQPLPDAQRAKEAAPLETADQKGDSAQAAESRAEPTSAAPLGAMAKDQAPDGIISAPAPEEAATDTASDPAAEDAAAFSQTPSDDAASLTKDSLPTVTPEKAPADPALILTTDGESPDEDLSSSAEQYPALSAPTWWKALEILLAVLALAFLGGLFFRWQRYRSRSDT